MTDDAVVRVVTVVLNWNGWRDTAACLRSLDGIEGVEQVVLVVDNGSTDRSVERLRADFPGLWILETGANLGFAGGMNRGIAAALERGADFVWLLNNDATVAPDSLRRLVEASCGRSDVGLACSKILFADRPDTIWFAGGVYSTPGGVTAHLGLGETDRGQFDRAGETEFACGCSLLVGRRTLADIGPLPEEYHLYWEDVAWSARARAAGWAVVYVPQSRVWHRVGASLDPDSLPLQRLKARYELRNRVLFHRTHHPERVGRVLRHAMVQATMMLKSRVWFGHAVAHWRGIVDGLLGRTGPIRTRSRPGA